MSGILCTSFWLIPVISKPFQGQHYVSVDETDVISVVKGLEGKSNISELTSMTDEAQGFAYR